MIPRMGERAGRQGKVTPVHLAEAKRLREIWDRTKQQRTAQGYGSQEAFGQAFEIGNQSAVGFFLNGKTALSFKAASGFARGLECRIADFSPRLAELGEVTETPPGNLELGLANAFAEVPSVLPDGTTKGALYNELIGWLGNRVRKASAGAPAPEPPAEATPTPPTGRQKRRARARSA
jgi:hypothetical protein